MKVLVTGASGFIGSRLCRYLQQVGHEVIAVVRPRSAPARYPAGTIVYAQLPYGIPFSAFDGLEAIIHCAGTTTGQSVAESIAVNVETTRVLCEHAAKCDNLRRLIYISSQSAHERAISIYGRTKRAGEDVVRRSSVPYAIVRPGLVFGPGNEGLFARMRRTVERLPVIPLLGGGKALVQPIEVTDLCRALERCLHLPPGESFEFNLGEPEPMTLAEFLQAIAQAHRGKRKPAISIPLAPLEFLVRTAERLRMPLPVTTDNIEGMKTVPRMETLPSLTKLDLTLTPFAEAIQCAVRKTAETALVQEPLRVILVGAGKIGIVHALDLVNRPGIALVGLVDNNRKATRLYQQMGFRLPHYADLASGLKALRPAAAIIATPAFTHLELLRECLAAGLHVLVEKPLVVSPEQFPAYEELRNQYPRQVVHVGYMAAQFPQLDVARGWLNEKRIGEVIAVWASAVQSHIIAPKPMRWEMRKELAGGGVLVNFGCHLLSMLFRLFGLPNSADGKLWRIHSPQVEDAADLSLTYDSFPARFVTSWSAKGYARPEMRLVIEGSDGIIILTYAGVELICRNGENLVFTQRDFDVGFNPAPDYTGAAFACEHMNFFEAVASRDRNKHVDPGSKAPFSETPVEISEALALERFIHDLYGRLPLLSQRPTVPAANSQSVSPFNAELDQLVETLQ
ncbi:MAG: Gfo/Idh/MocA family oxidoreductase [Candidatus Sumerlaeaceae bacterium]|nr:Gfo/Idh/MocA family oxidoreductase [Candidatus Sumerlaeaceae bacterium]